jgi:hypothetical protein
LDILSALPLLKGWRYDPKDLPSTVYTKRTPLVNIKNEKGWFLWSLATFSNPRANIRVTYDEYYSANISPIELFSAGLTTSNAAGFWVGTYNPVLNVYCIFFTPDYAWPFTKSLLIEIEPPPGGTVSVANFGCLLIRIDDTAAFEQSLKAVLGK